MSTSVTGYYTAPTMPVQTTTAPAQPVPVNVDVNNTPSPSLGNLNIDQYLPSMANAASYAPYAEGALAGMKTLRGGQAGVALTKMSNMSSKSRNYSKVVSGARSSIWQNLGATTMRSGIISGLVSAATNGYKMYKGELTVAQGGSNIAGDVAGGIAGGLGAGVATALGATVLTTMGIAGLPLTIAGLGLGIVGFLAGDGLLRKLPVFAQGKQWVHDQLAKVSS